MPTDKQILKTLMPYLEAAQYQLKKLTTTPFFSLDDLVGKTIAGTRKIKNPLPYNPKTQSPNPLYFKVLLFSDESYLLHMHVGWQDGTTLHTFLVEKDDIKYSTQLYEVDINDTLETL